MPNVSWDDSHERFISLAQQYWLDAGLFWEVENKYNLREWLLLSIVIAETSWGHRWYWTSTCNNPANNNNNDRWTRVCYDSFREWLEQAAKTINNKYLWQIQTLGCMSNGGNCQARDDSWYRYATSNWNWERNVVAALETIYWECNPATFKIRRDFNL